MFSGDKEEYEPWRSAMFNKITEDARLAQLSETGIIEYIASRLEGRAKDFVDELLPDLMRATELWGCLDRKFRAVRVAPRRPGPPRR